MYFKYILTRLDKINCPYMIVGSFASAYYGEPRLTNDVDIVIKISAETVPLLAQTFPHDVFYLPPEEVLLSEIPSNGQFNRLGGSEKHLRDIKSILIRTPIDKLYLMEWVQTLKLQDEWAKC